MVCECCTMNPLNCRHWLLHESKVDNLLILFFQLGNRVNRKAENERNFLRMVWGKTQKKSMESLCDDSVFLSVTVWCFFFFLLKPSLVQLSGEKWRKRIVVLQHLQWVWHSMTRTKPKWWDAAETCASGALNEWTAGSFLPLLTLDTTP